MTPREVTDLMCWRVCALTTAFAFLFYTMDLTAPALLLVFVAGIAGVVGFINASSA